MVFEVHGGSTNSFVECFLRDALLGLRHKNSEKISWKTRSGSNSLFTPSTVSSPFSGKFASVAFLQFIVIHLNLFRFIREDIILFTYTIAEVYTGGSGFSPEIMESVAERFAVIFITTT